MLELALLGRLDLRDAAGTEVQQLLGRPKLVALLAYLAAARPYGFHRRDRIVAVFWPEQDQQRARNALRQAVHHLRAALGPDALRARGDEELAVDPPVIRCDVVSFTDLVAAGRTAEALELVQGDLLPGFHLSDVPEFERWLDEEREHLRRQAASAARKLADVEEADGDLAGAAHWIRRALQLAPYEEESLMRLLGLLDRIGDRAGAVREYEAFARRLDQDLGVEPAPETQALLERARTRNEVVAASPEREAVTSEPPPATGDTDPPIAREQPQAPTPPRRSRIVAIAVAAIAVGAVSWALWPRSGIGPPDSERPSIAVLPLDNLSGDPDQEYFADGMTDEIIGELSRIAELRVISRTSVMQFKVSDLPLSVIADSLGVDHILEASVMREGDRVRIRAQLVAVNPEGHLWTDVFERDAQDVLALQRDVAQAVAGTLRGVLAPESEWGMQDAARVPPPAYEAYLRGQHDHNRFDFLGALWQYDFALAFDSTFAPAWAATAKAIHALRVFRPENDTGMVLAPRQEAAARRAIALDETLAEGHLELAHFFRDEWEWHQAEREYRRALQLNPGHLETLRHYALFLSHLGRHDEAIALARNALDLDPRGVRSKSDLGNVLLAAGRVDEAIAQFQFTLEWHPGNDQALEGLGIAYVQRGMFEEAIATMRQQSESFRRFNLAYALAMAGRDAEARQIVAERSANRPITRDPRNRTYLELAGVYGALGDVDRAFEYLEEAYQQHNGWLVYLNWPYFEPLQADPRWDHLLRRMRFPESASIAVLPLQDLSGDPDQDYFADGMTDEIVLELGRIAGLRVISRTSVMRYKGADLPLRTIADSLGGVGYVLEGSVMREGDRVRIRAQLVDVRPEEDPLWSQAFERDAHDVLALQRDVAQAVAETLRGVLAQEEEPLALEPRRVRPEVYEAYLRGKHLINRFDFLGALREYDRAIALDSTFAPAWAATAGAISGLRAFPPDNDTGRTMVSRQEAAARRAIALDSTLASGHGELAGYLLRSGFPPFQGNLLEQAEREIQRAIQLSPGNPGARESYAEVLSWIYGRHDEAIAQARIALDLDPLSAGRQTQLGLRLLEAGRVDEAIAQFRFTLEWNPGHGGALEGLGIAYVQLGRFDDAVAAMRQNGDPTVVAWALAMAGRDAEARRTLGEGGDYLDRAAVFAALDDLDRAFEYLEEAYRQRIVWLVFIRHPAFAPLRGDPRYDDLVRRIGFPEPE